MSRAPKIDRARRNALKAASLVGAFLATAALHRQASAAPGGNGNGGTNGNGGNGNGGNNGNGGTATATPTATTKYGGNCFARGTQIRTREGYRPIETLTAGDEVAVRFEGFAPIKAMVSHTLNSVLGKWDGNSRICRFSYGEVLWVRTRRPQIFASRLCMPSTLMGS